MSVDPIFKKNRMLGLRVVLLLLLALTCMIFNARSVVLRRARVYLSYVVYPIQYVVNVPIDVTNLVISNLTTHRALLSDNTHLKGELLLMKAKLQQRYAIVSENEQLRALLESSTQVPQHVTEAQLLAVNLNPFIKQIVLNKGGKAGVNVGQAVLDAYGVMGQVVQVTPWSSHVMLLTDRSSAIPVQDSQNGIRAIAEGVPQKGVLQLKDVTSTMPIHTGDLLVSSGLGGCYPFGYPVGKVISVQNDPSQPFLQIFVRPLAHLNRSRLVLIVQTVPQARPQTVSQAVSQTTMRPSTVLARHVQAQLSVTNKPVKRATPPTVGSTV